MASRKRLASWSTALSHERVAWEEAEDEQLAAERQVEELQDQIAEVEAEREGLESRLAAVGAEREARAETERDLEEALEQVQTAEELTASLQVELEALRGGESARSQAPPSAGAWPRCRRCGWHLVSDPEQPLRPPPTAPSAEPCQLDARTGRRGGRRGGDHPRGDHPRGQGRARSRHSRGGGAGLELLVVLDVRVDEAAGLAGAPTRPVRWR